MNRGAIFSVRENYLYRKLFREIWHTVYAKNSADLNSLLLCMRSYVKIQITQRFFFYRCPEHCTCQLDVLAGAGLLGDRAAVLCAAIKESFYDAVLHTSSQVRARVSMWACNNDIANVQGCVFH
jgi:hypothetical protein